MAGNYQTALKEFYSLRPVDVTPIGPTPDNPRREGFLGRLGNGTVLNVRNQSTYKGGAPTLEFKKPSGQANVKVRYVNGDQAQKNLKSK